MKSSVTLSIRITEKEHNTLKTIAENLNMTKSAVLKKLFRDNLDYLELKAQDIFLEHHNIMRIEKEKLF